MCKGNSHLMKVNKFSQNHTGRVSDISAELARINAKEKSMTMQATHILTYHLTQIVTFPLADSMLMVNGQNRIK